jgi:hypothetical protein
MVDAADLKSASRKGVWVRVPPSAVNLCLVFMAYASFTIFMWTCSQVFEHLLLHFLALPFILYKIVIDFVTKPLGSNKTLHVWENVILLECSKPS